MPKLRAERRERERERGYYKNVIKTLKIGVQVEELRLTLSVFAYFFSISSIFVLLQVQIDGVGIKCNERR